ncbi:GDSL-type esterase/lipase family protein [Streptomyces iconiensis]|uniref:FG-GAP-like repeat-containing protein n=1 Tax=Streptomyces iconiensis TaxID=1384038 RepID=A0ABT6ZV93_9ACTN|nr:GDSL-type esterase/lipase family protein [Streptomyces iconiensis]MDJ1132990.1 FG-GAP-like repeat-containing protein [Streptomyces iconiensis]
MTAPNEQERSELANWWAPVHFQDVDTSGETALGGKSDYITSYDFDGDLNGRNNWENTSEKKLKAHVYYSVVETEKYAYVLYTFFHPRDWADASLDDYLADASEHENDAEGVLVVVERDGSEHGKLTSAITVSHSDFYSYIPKDSDWKDGEETKDGELPLLASSHGDGHARPFTAQQAGTHAAWSATAKWKGLDKNIVYSEYLHGDGVLYQPGNTAEEPSGPNDRDTQYDLIDVFAPNGMWDQQNNKDLFAEPNKFAGDDSSNPNEGGACGDGGVLGPASGECGIDSANPPWAWDDKNDLPGPGHLAYRPEELARNYFDWPGEPSGTKTEYLWNEYIGVTPPDDPGRPEEPSGDWRVMGLGSSSTYGQGSSDGNGYRGAADAELRKQSRTLDWVGSVRVGTMADRDVEGWPGYRISEIAGKAQCAVKTYQPNMVTLVAGANDVIQDYQMDGAIGRLEALAKQVVADSPGAVVMVGAIQPFPDAARNARAGKLNAQMADMVKRLAGGGMHIAFTDGGLQVSDIGPDGIHPNDAGYAKMGRAFAATAASAKSSGWIRKPNPEAPNAGSHPCGLKDDGTGAVPGGGDLGGKWSDSGVIQSKEFRSSNRFWLVDINKDSKAEFVTVDKDQNMRFWWNGGPSGSKWVPFVEGENAYKPTAGAVGNALRFGDIDGDGFPDCMVVDLQGHVNISTWNASKPSGQRMCTKKYDGVGSVFSKGSTGDRPHIDASTQIRFADVTGGGRDDYLLIEPDGSTTAWYNRDFQLANGRKYLDWTPPQNISGPLQNPRQIRYADINGDKRDDRLLITAKGGVRAWINEGAKGAGGKYRDIGRIAGDSGLPPKDIKFADMNGDGKADFVRIGWTGVAHAWLNKLTAEDFKVFHP